MAHQLGLSGDVGCQPWNGPRPLVHSASPLGRQRLARRKRLVRTDWTGLHGAQRGVGNRRLVAKRRRYVFAEVVVRFAVRGQIAPQIAAGRLIHVRNLLQQRIPVGHDAFVIVWALLTTVVLLPGLLEVIGADSCGRPNVAVAGDFA